MWSLFLHIRAGRMAAAAARAKVFLGVDFAWFIQLKMNLREFFDRYTDMLYIFKDINKTKLSPQQFYEWIQNSYEHLYIQKG